METINERVKSVIEKEVRPALMADGGDIELVSVEDGVVKVRLYGSCAGCPFRQMTLASGVEARIKEKVPEIERVELVE